MERIYEIAPIRALPRHRDRFDYLGPEKLIPGLVLAIPFRGSRTLGVVLGEKQKSEIQLTRLSSLGPSIVHGQLTERQLSLAKWMAQEYHTSLGQVLKSFLLTTKELPSTLPNERDPSGPKKSKLSFTEYLYVDQRNQLLLATINKDLQQKRRVICLFPERSVLESFFTTLPSQLKRSSVVIHGSLPGPTHRAARQAIRSGNAHLLIGTTSALFEPLPKGPWVLYVDDESHPSYKQTDRQPHYHVRDLALRFFAQGADLHFYGQTPSLDLVSLLRANQGLWRRITGRIPAIEIVSFAGSEHGSLLGFQLDQALREALSRTQRAILYYNRRGGERSLHCADCSWIPRCLNCDTLLRSEHATLRCRLCGLTQPIPQSCPNCHSVRIQSLGHGVRRLAESVKRAFPSARVAIVEQGSKPDDTADILIGTSVLFRHNLRKVSLSAMISYESEFLSGEWWSKEQANANIRRLAGLTAPSGKILVQTRILDILSSRILTDVYNSTLRPELLDRQRFGYPPFVALVKLTQSGEPARMHAEAKDVISRLTEKKKTAPSLLSISPPVRSGHTAKRETISLLLKFHQSASSEDREAVLKDLPAGWMVDVRPIRLSDEPNFS